MSRKKPNIITPYNTKGQTNDLIQNIFDDMFVTHHTPDSSSDYVDIYLQSIKINSNKYEVSDNGTNVVVTFNQALVAEPGDIVAGDFLVKGKIVSR